MIREFGVFMGLVICVNFVVVVVYFPSVLVIEEMASNIIEKISGDKLNESSIKAAVEDLSKKNIGEYL